MKLQTIVYLISNVVGLLRNGVCLLKDSHMLNPKKVKNSEVKQLRVICTSLVIAVLVMTVLVFYLTTK